MVSNFARTICLHLQKTVESNGRHFEGGSELSISAEGDEVLQRLSADSSAAPEGILNEISGEHSETVS